MRPAGPDGYGSRIIAFVLAPLLFPQSRVVLSHLPVLDEANGRWKGVIDGPDPMRLLVFGDSTAAGVGVDQQDDGLAVAVASEVAERFGRGVIWKVIARSGATTGELRTFFLPRARRGLWDLIVLSTGVNDVMNLRRKRQFSHDLGLILDGLHESSPHAIILLPGIPRMDRFDSLPDPLNTILGARAHRLNVGARTAVKHRPYVVHTKPWPIGAPGFFARDNFHPSKIGYSVWAKAMVTYWLR